MTEEGRRVVGGCDRAISFHHTGVWGGVVIRRDNACDHRSDKEGEITTTVKDFCLQDCGQLGVHGLDREGGDVTMEEMGRGRSPRHHRRCRKSLSQKIS